MPRALLHSLTLGGLMGLVAGLALIIAGVWPALGFDLMIAEVAPHLAGEPPTTIARQAIQVSGALTLGLGAAALAARPVFAGRADARGGARAFAVGLIVWYLPDTAGSIDLGIPFNAVGNTIFLALLLPPAVAFARRGPPA